MLRSGATHLYLLSTGKLPACSEPAADMSPLWPDPSLPTIKQPITAAS